MFAGELLLAVEEFGLALDGVFVGDDSLLERYDLRLGAMGVEDAIEFGEGITAY